MQAEGYSYWKKLFGRLQTQTSTKVSIIVHDALFERAACEGGSMMLLEATPTAESVGQDLENDRGFHFLLDVHVLRQKPELGPAKPTIAKILYENLREERQLLGAPATTIVPW